MWDGFAIMLIIYNAFFIPYNLAFITVSTGTPPFGPTNSGYPGGASLPAPTRSFLPHKANCRNCRQEAC